MDMFKTSSGKLRAIAYDANSRTLRVELDDGTALEYANVGESVWCNFRNSAAQWSYYRDNIEEEFTARRVSARSGADRPAGRNPLDDLFR